RRRSHAEGADPALGTNRLAFQGAQAGLAGRLPFPTPTGLQSGMTFPFVGKARAALVLASLLAAAPVVAQPAPRTLTVTPTAAWGHAETGMILPPRVGTLVRQQIQDNSQEEFDVVATYMDRDTGVIALVYLYRTMTASVPLWFDRAVATIMLPQTGAAFPAITP